MSFNQRKKGRHNKGPSEKAAAHVKGKKKRNASKKFRGRLRWHPGVTRDFRQIEKKEF